MKPLKNVVPLVIIIAAIITFWLKPGINTASHKRYTRIYENTDQKKSVNDTTKIIPVRASSQVVTVPVKKKYKEESIDLENISKLKSSMFSRSVHFLPELTDSLMEDSVNYVEIEMEETPIDSTNALSKN